MKSLENLGVDVKSLQNSRRNFASPCLDWSERKPHLAGALGSALLDLALKREWLTRDPGSRALEVTELGRRELRCYFELEL
jgi:hypothetical protein